MSPSGTCSKIVFALSTAIPPAIAGAICCSGNMDCRHLHVDIQCEFLWRRAFSARCLAVFCLRHTIVSGVYVCDVRLRWHIVRSVARDIAASHPREHPLQGSRSPVPVTDPSGLVPVQRTCFQIVPGREVGGEGGESPVKEESRARWVFGHGSEKKPSERSSRGFGESGCQA